MPVSPHACVDPTATLEADVDVGPFCVVGPDVRVGRGTRLVAHVTLLGPATLGSRTRVQPGVVIGEDTRVGSRVELGAGTTLDRGAQVLDDAFVDPGVCVGPAVTIGTWSHVRGPARIDDDVPPFVVFDQRPQAIHVSGLRRGGWTDGDIEALLDTFQLVFRGRAEIDEARETLRAAGRLRPAANQLLTFLEDRRDRLAVRGRERRRAA